MGSLTLTSIGAYAKAASDFTSMEHSTGEFHKLHIPEKAPAASLHGLSFYSSAPNPVSVIGTLCSSVASSRANSLS